MKSIWVHSYEYTYMHLYVAVPLHASISWAIPLACLFMCLLFVQERQFPGNTEFIYMPNAFNKYILLENVASCHFSWISKVRRFSWFYNCFTMLSTNKFKYEHSHYNLQTNIGAYCYRLSLEYLIFEIMNGNNTWFIFIMTTDISVLLQFTVLNQDSPNDKSLKLLV